MARDNGYTQAEIHDFCKGRTKEQQQVIKYLLTGGGCLSFGKMKDDEYAALVEKYAKSMDFRQKALNKLGVDESQVQEIAPIQLCGYYFSEKDDSFAKWVKRSKWWVSSAYQISRLFFSDTQVYVYQYLFHLDSDIKKERTEEYFYKDITNFSTSSDTIEKWIYDRTNCNGQDWYVRKSVEENKFVITVPGDKFYCSIDKLTEDVEGQIQGLKAKLREKKQ